jgi:hypothetical protein
MLRCWGFSKCAAPAELFFIERGCLSKKEIGEREICMHLRICRTRTVARASPSPPTRDKRKAGLVYPANILDGAQIFYVGADISWTQIFHGRRYFMDADISWTQIFHGRRYFMDADISWARIFHGR